MEQESQREIVLEVAEKRAQPLHLRQRRRQEGLATLINGKEKSAEVLKTKDRRGETEEVAPIPTISAENHGRLQKDAE